MITILHEQPERPLTCFQCKESPQVRHFKAEDGHPEQWDFSCVFHGHYGPRGDTYAQAVHYWNVYMSFMLREVTEDLIDAGKGTEDTSFCFYIGCRRFTRNKIRMAPGIYALECAECHLIKYTNQKKVAA